jgi:hypothetical protein
MAVLASVIAGAAWTLALATLNVSAQLALPDWVRGRGLAMFVATSFGAMAAGSAIWGWIQIQARTLANRRPRPYVRLRSAKSSSFDPVSRRYSDGLPVARPARPRSQATGALF